MAEDLVAELHHPETWRRWRAAGLIGPDASPSMLEALVEALADESYTETPGDYDAPPLHYGVSNAAAESLSKGPVDRLLPALTAVMRRSPHAARHVAMLLRQGGEGAVEPLAELLAHSSAAVREDALGSLVPLWNRVPSDRLLALLLQALADPDAGVTFRAVRLCNSFFPLHPGLCALRLAPVGLLERLLARLRDESGAGTYAQAVALFADEPEARDFARGPNPVLQCYVDLAAAGAPEPAKLLVERRERLSEAQIVQLVEGVWRTPQLELLCQLGERAAAAIPRLRSLADQQDEACVALLRLAGEARGQLDRIFLEQRSLRFWIWRHHPDPASFAAVLLPRLRARTERADALEALGILGPDAAPALPWVLPYLTSSAPPLERHYASLIVAGLGEAARPAFPCLARLLDCPSCRHNAFTALAGLGAVASEFAPLLQVLQLELHPVHAEERAALEQIEKVLPRLTCAKEQ